jgi:hypothetical protein
MSEEGVRGSPLNAMKKLVIDGFTGLSLSSENRPIRVI